MLKQRVIIKCPSSDLFGQEGVIVAEKYFYKHRLLKSRESIVCKVLIGETISNWIPRQWLEEIWSKCDMPEY
jgi:hypothetical protein